MRDVTSIGSTTWLRFVFIFLAAFATWVSVSGCSTSLVVDPIKPGSEQSTVPVGIIYYPPKVQFEVILTRFLKTCPDDQSHVPVEVELEARITPSYLADTTQAYLINYNELNSAFKKTTLSVSLYENGTLKSINAQVTDRTAEVAKNIFSTGVQIARMAMGVPPLMAPGAPTIPPKPRWTCNPLIKRTTIEYAQKTQEVKKAAETFAYCKTKPECDNAEILLNKEQAALSKLKEPLIDSQIYSIEPRLSDLTSAGQYPEFHPHIYRGVWKETLTPRNALLERWFDAMQAVVTDFASMPGTAEVLIFVPRFPLETTAVSTSEVTRNLKYREPVVGELIVCPKSEENDERKSIISCRKDGRLILRSERVYNGFFSIPQAGLEAQLELHNDPFDDNNLAAEFDRSGALTMFKFITESQAEKASATLADATSSAGAALDASRSSELTRAKADTDLLKAETDRINAELALEEARKKRKASPGD
jgi:hypothetical protein